MRWPINLQLLLPTLLVVVLAIGLTSAASAYLGAERAGLQQEENLRRVVTTLAEAAFPLTDRVLQQMSGLSGAEFVLLDDRQQLEAATVKIGKEEVASLRELPVEKDLRRASGMPVAELGGRRYLAHRVPVIRRLPVPGRGSLVVLYEEDRRRSGVWQAARPTLLAGGIAALAAVLLTAAAGRRLTGPIRQLGAETARIAAGRFQPVAVPPRDDELRALALAVNAMAEKLSHYEQEVRSHERLRTLGQLGAAVAHQLRNAATGARMAIELHQRECNGVSPRESLEVALRQLRLMESYLQRFLRIGHRGPAEPQEVDLGAAVGEVLELVRPACTHGKIDLGFRGCSEPVAVWGDPDALRDLLMNVVLNAIEAARCPGEAQPRVLVELARQGDGRAVLRVLDSGPGPEVEEGQDLFEPFVSRKPEGAGLGLFVARRVAEDHHGSIRWERLDNMTCFTVEIPWHTC